MTIKINKSSFLFYDYETFGLHPALDKPAQFACIRTDDQLNIIENPIVLYCYPSFDYLPNIQSMLITKIIPQYTYKFGYNEFQFSKKIFNIFNVPNTCIIGYNNIQFDDEFTRNIFYRNLLDPYSWSWKNGNSRWDVMKIVLACYILFPDNLYWPKDNLGSVSFKLSKLTNINNIVHKNKHDALSDVYATIYLMKLIKNHKRELFNFLFKYRLKNNLINFIDISKRIPIIYISNIFGNIRNYTSYIIPLFWNSNNTNMLIFFDLHYDIHNLLNYLKNIDIYSINMKQLYNLGINFLYINRCPILIPIYMLNKKRLDILDINNNLYIKNINLLYQSDALLQRIDLFFKNFRYNNCNSNVDLSLYDNFFSQKDKYYMNIIHNTSINTLHKKKLFFDDIKLHKLFFRLRARNFPNFLNIQEKKKWFLYRSNKLNSNYINNYLIYLKKMYNKYYFDPKKIILLNNIKTYINNIS